MGLMIRSSHPRRRLLHTAAIPKGARVAEYTGHPLTKEQADLSYEDSPITYLFGLGDGKIVIDGHSMASSSTTVATPTAKPKKRTATSGSRPSETSLPPRKSPTTTASTTAAKTKRSATAAQKNAAAHVLNRRNPPPQAAAKKAAQRRAKEPSRPARRPPRAWESIGLKTLPISSVNWVSDALPELFNPISPRRENDSPTRAKRG